MPDLYLLFIGRLHEDRVTYIETLAFPHGWSDRAGAEAARDELVGRGAFAYGDFSIQTVQLCPGPRDVVAPVSFTHKVRGGRNYTIHLCSKCDQQVTRSTITDRYECPNHGDRITIRVATVPSCTLRLGDPL